MAYSFTMSNNSSESGGKSCNKKEAGSSSITSSGTVIPTDSLSVGKKKHPEESEKSTGKRPRTNYKDPENSAKLSAALSMLINRDGDAQIMKDIKSVAQLFGVPYNTLRDNYIRY